MEVRYAFGQAPSIRPIHPCAQDLLWHSRSVLMPHNKRPVVIRIGEPHSAHGGEQPKDGLRKAEVFRGTSR